MLALYAEILLSARIDHDLCWPPVATPTGVSVPALVSVAIADAGIPGAAVAIPVAAVANPASVAPTRSTVG